LGCKKNKGWRGRQPCTKDAEEKGPTYFEGKDSNVFGKLTSKEWSHMLYKHIDHHFSQFGV
jgi:hypothetical protein